MLKNTTHFKELLNTELATLEKELATVGRKNPENPSDWEATEAEDVDTAEEGEVAGGIETYENNKGVLNQLEVRLQEVRMALGKIDQGTFGKCEVCGGEIEEDRLEANPAAATCKKHMS